MSGVHLVHECLFCSHSFDSAAAKDDHILGHFAQETCLECNRDLLRIGDALYTRHDSSTCIKRAVKIEEHTDSINVHSSIRNDIEYTLNNLECVYDFRHDDVSPWQKEDQSKEEQQSSFTNLSELIDRHFIPDNQNNEMSEPQQSIAFCETIVHVKVEPNERNDEQSSSVQNETAQEKFEMDDKLVESTEENSFSCKFCGMEMASNAALHNHRCSIISANKTKTNDTQGNACDICGKTFRHKNNVSRHKRNLHAPPTVDLKSTLKNPHGNNRSRKSTDRGKANACDVCGKTFNHSSSVYRHKLISHTPAGIIICNVCGRRFDNYEAREFHREECALKIRLRYSTSTGELKCDYCQKKFRLDASLRRHIRIKHNSNVDKYPCPLCPAIFMKESSLQAHICPRSIEHTCDICGQKLSTPVVLQVHKVIRHSPIGTIFCNRCGKLFSTAEKRDEHKFECTLSKRIYELKKHGEFECYICHKKIKSKGNLRRHMRTMHDPDVDKFRCKICGAIFINESSIEHHRCTGRPQYVRRIIPCEVCGKIFAHTGSLRHHHILMHPTADTILCRTCKKSFATVDDLEAHRRQCESKTRSFTCNICGRILAHNSIRKHTVWLHSPPGTIFCKVCAKIFPTIDERDKHQVQCKLKCRLDTIRRFGRFECDNCGHVVKTKRDLRRHMLVNHVPDGDKFKCKSCKRIFFLESSVQKHQCKGTAKKEWGRKLIPCEACGKIIARGSIYAHRIAFHSPPGTLYCRACFKIFRKVDDLNAHSDECKKKINTPRQCNICHKMLANLKALTRHKISMHSAPGTIFCKTCVKKFKTVEELNLHIPECKLKRKLRKTKRV